MKKIASPDTTYAEAALDLEGTARTLDTEDLVTDNAQLVHYLNSLLTSAPQSKIDFSEAGFYCDQSTGDPAVDEVIYFGAELTKHQVRELKNENSLLKLKVARLIAQLNDTEFKLDALSAENTNLKSDIDSLQNRIHLYKSVISDAPRRVLDNPAPVVAGVRAPVVHEAAEGGSGSGRAVEELPTVVEAPAVEQLSLEAETAAEHSPDELPGAAPELSCGDSAGGVSSDSGTVEPGQRADVRAEPRAGLMLEPQADPEPAQCEPAQCEAVAPIAPILPILPAPEIAGQQEKSAVVGKPAVDRGRVITAPSRLVYDSSDQKRVPDAGVIFSNKVPDQPVPRTRTVSKIIKRKDLDSEPPRSAPPPVSAARAAEPKPSPAPKPPMQVPEAREREDGDMPLDVLLSLGSAEACGETAPVTKAVVLKHIENYRLIQEEADSTEVVTGPDLDGKA